jgi:protein phosphatase
MAREALLESDRDPVHALAAANERIHHTAEADAGLKGMGCVASALRIDGASALVAHVGDTRVYLTSAAGCEQLTADHTVAASRQEELGIDERRARDIGGRNQVTRDIGGQPRPGQDWIDRIEVALEDDDLLVLCSDGLHGVMRNGELFTRLREARRDKTPPEAVVDSLVGVALERGTRDNVTVIAVRRLHHERPAEAVPQRRSNVLAVLLFVLGFALGFLARGCEELPYLWQGW